MSNWSVQPFIAMGKGGKKTLYVISGESENSRPLGLLGGSEHFTDVDGGQHEAARLARRRITLVNINPHGTSCPRTDMLQHVIKLDIHRPCPFDT